MQRLMRQCAQLEIESSNITDGGHSLGQGDALVMIQHGAGLCCFQKLSFFFGSYLASFSCFQKYFSKRVPSTVLILLSLPLCDL